MSKKLGGVRTVAAREKASMRVRILNVEDLENIECHHDSHDVVFIQYCTYSEGRTNPRRRRALDGFGLATFHQTCKEALNKEEDGQYR